MNNGWIKLHRQLVDWEWYDDIPTKISFLHLILVCNYNKTKWRGIELEVGETMKSLETLAKESGLSVRQWRVALEKLKMTGSLTERRHGKFRILKLETYNQYQVNDTIVDNEMTMKWQGHDTDMTADKKVRREEVKKERNEGGQATPPTPSDEARRFFEIESEREPVILKLIEHGLDAAVVRSEVKKFCGYWTEKNKSGTKQKWQLMTTFEVKRRLKTWIENVSKFSPRSK